MKKIGGALKRLRAKTRGIASRRDGDGGGAPKKAGGGRAGTNDAGRRQLATFGIAMVASLAVFAGLTLCEFGAVRGLTPFGPSCARGSQIAENLSIGAGAGFLVFLIAEVVVMVFAELFRQRRIDAEERRAEAAERRAEIAELSRKLEAAELSRRAEAAESRAEIAELWRKFEASELSRKTEIAERRAEFAELSRKAEAAELSRKAEAERAARLELELEIARNAAKNGDAEGEGG